MGDKTQIEWTDATWNPIRGCSVVSEGCRNCYAMQVAARFSQRYWEVWQGSTLISSAKQKLTEAEARNKVENEARNGVLMEARESEQGQAYAGLAYRNSSGAHWTGKVRLIEEHLQDPLRWKRPRRIFVNSMSDLFHENLTDYEIFRVFNVMQRSPQHVFQILTKRPARMAQFIDWLTGFYERLAYVGVRWPLPNVWLGVSAEDQKTANERIPLLLETPAAIRWISLEPLLGPIDLTYIPTGADGDPSDASSLDALRGVHYVDAPVEPVEKDGIDWVVVGGESGSGARPMHPDWVRSLRDQCTGAGVAFFFKQWGEWANSGECDDPCGRCVMALRSWDGSSWRGSELTGTNWEAGRPGALQLHPVGKKKAGRLLDDREWNEYPSGILNLESEITREVAA